LAPALDLSGLLPGTSVALRGTTAEHSSVAPKLHPSSPPNKPGNSGAFARNNSCSVGRPSAQKKNPRDGGIRQFAVPPIHAATRTTKAKEPCTSRIPRAPSRQSVADFFLNTNPRWSNKGR
jgi:hypothetical protein